MSEAQLNTFLEAVKADAGLQEKLKAAKDVDAVVEIAKEAHFVISADELKKSQAEVSDEELEGVAGGGPGNWNESLLRQSRCDECALIRSYY